MRQHPSVQFALVVAAFLALPAPSRADPIAPASLVPALQLYADSLALGHAAATACADAGFVAVNDEQWSNARDMLVATLWANGFAADTVRDLTRRLDAPAPAAKPDCADPAVLDSFARPEQEGWMMAVANTILGMDLAAIPRPVSAGQWQAIKDAIAADLPRETRMLDCIAVTYPEVLPVAVHDWDAMIVATGGKLVAAGLPHDEIGAVLSAAEANSLWHRVAPGSESALRASCAGDKTWTGWMSNLEGFAGTLGADIDKLLPKPPGDTAN